MLVSVEARGMEGGRLGEGVLLLLTCEVVDGDFFLGRHGCVWGCVPLCCGCCGSGHLGGLETGFLGSALRKGHIGSRDVGATVASHWRPLSIDAATPRLVWAISEL